MTTDSLTEDMTRVALQETASAVRLLRSRLRSHLIDEDLLESDAVPALSGAVLAVLTDVAMTPERWGLDPLGLDME